MVYQSGKYGTAEPSTPFSKAERGAGGGIVSPTLSGGGGAPSSKEVTVSVKDVITEGGKAIIYTSQGQKYYKTKTGERIIISPKTIQPQDTVGTYYYSTEGGKTREVKLSEGAPLTLKTKEGDLVRTTSGWELVQKPEDLQKLSGQRIYKYLGQYVPKPKRYAYDDRGRRLLSKEETVITQKLTQAEERAVKLSLAEQGLAGEMSPQFRAKLERARQKELSKIKAKREGQAYVKIGGKEHLISYSFTPQVPTLQDSSLLWSYPFLKYYPTEEDLKKTKLKTPPSEIQVGKSKEQYVKEFDVYSKEAGLTRRGKLMETPIYEIGKYSLGGIALGTIEETKEVIAHPIRTTGIIAGFEIASRIPVVKQAVTIGIIPLYLVSEAFSERGLGFRSIGKLVPYVVTGTLLHKTINVLAHYRTLPFISYKIKRALGFRVTTREFETVISEKKVSPFKVERIKGETPDFDYLQISLKPKPKPRATFYVEYLKRTTTKFRPDVIKKLKASPKFMIELERRGIKSPEEIVLNIEQKGLAQVDLAKVKAKKPLPQDFLKPKTMDLSYKLGISKEPLSTFELRPIKAKDITDVRGYERTLTNLYKRIISAKKEELTPFIKKIKTEYLETIIEFKPIINIREFSKPRMRQIQVEITTRKKVPVRAHERKLGDIYSDIIKLKPEKTKRPIESILFGKPTKRPYTKKTKAEKIKKKKRIIDLDKQYKAYQELQDLDGLTLEKPFKPFTKKGVAVTSGAFKTPPELAPLIETQFIKTKTRPIISVEPELTSAVATIPPPKLTKAPYMEDLIEIPKVDDKLFSDLEVKQITEPRMKGKTLLEPKDILEQTQRQEPKSSVRQAQGVGQRIKQLLEQEQVIKPKQELKLFQEIIPKQRQRQRLLLDLVEVPKPPPPDVPLGFQLPKFTKFPKIDVKLFDKEPKKREKKSLLTPLADWLSMTLTEGKLLKRATHPAITPKTVREFAEGIKLGVMRFPTMEMKKGLIK